MPALTTTLSLSDEDIKYLPSVQNYELKFPYSIEEVAEAGPEAIRWLQLYIYKDREVTKQLVRRAERMGYKAIFVTVDTPYLGNRFDDVRNRFKMPPQLR